MICYGNLEHYPQPPTRVNIRVSFVHNSQEFHAKRVSYFAKKILFVTRKSSFAKANETKLCKVMIACWTLNKKTPVLFIFKLSSFKSRSLLWILDYLQLALYFSRHFIMTEETSVKVTEFPPSPSVWTYERSVLWVGVKIVDPAWLPLTGFSKSFLLKLWQTSN